jgi:hypothetical protein
MLKSISTSLGTPPLMTHKIEAVVQHSVRGKCINTPGVYIHEIDGFETHVHVCMSVAPTVHVADASPDPGAGGNAYREEEWRN